jgi:peptidoglycan hydrolase CwlO-like protein
MVARGFLVSEAGQALWSKDVVQDEWDIFEQNIKEKTVNIAEQCTGLTALVKNIETAAATLRPQIDAQNVATVRPALDKFLVTEVIGLIGQYMD